MYQRLAKALVLLCLLHQPLKSICGTVGCAGFGLLEGNEDEMDEESCKEFVRRMSLPFLPRNGHTRDPRLIWHQNLTDIPGDPECSGRGWLLSGPEPRLCHCFYESEGIDCRQNRVRQHDGIRAAVVYLLYGATKYEYALRESILHLTNSFLSQFPYPLVVFHSSNFAQPMFPGGPTFLQNIQAVTSIPIRFAEIEIEYPDNWKPIFEESPPTGMPCGNYSVNYLHMGRFFQRLLFAHPAVADFDYLWRLDADVELRLDIPCDIFDIMVRSHAVLGYYYYSDYEHHHCGVLEGRNATFAYAAARGFEPNHLHLLPPQSAYLGFWGVFDMSFWRSAPVTAFAAHMDALGLAYTHRMGEQAFYALATALLAPPAALHQYAGLGPFMHRGNEIIMGPREINGFNLVQTDVLCPAAAEWECNEVFVCTERAHAPPAAAPGGPPPPAEHAPPGGEGGLEERE